MKIIFLILMVSSCSILETYKTKPYVNPWIGLPVSKLDSHTIFLTTPYETRSLEDGVTVRSYKRTGGMMYGQGFASQVTCDHLFYLKNGLIIDHKTIGSCIERLPEN